MAQVNHYALRSMDSFFIKRDRGRANHMNHVLGLDYWDRFDLNEVEDRSIERYDASKQAWLDEFHANETLFALHRKSVRWHRNKARELRNDPGYAELYAGVRERLERAKADAAMQTAAE